MEIVVARLVVTQQPEHGELESVAMMSSEVTPNTYRDVYIAETWREVPIYDRSAFGPETVIEGPAIIEQFDSTIYIRPDRLLPMTPMIFYISGKLRIRSSHEARNTEPSRT